MGASMVLAVKSSPGRESLLIQLPKEKQQRRDPNSPRCSRRWRPVFQKNWWYSVNGRAPGPTPNSVDAPTGDKHKRFVHD